MVNKADKNEARLRRHRRVRGKISGTAERPRLDVFRSAKHIYAQLIDDEYNYTIEFVRDANGDALRPNVQVSNTGEISITFVTTVRTNTAFYEINYREAENA